MNICHRGEWKRQSIAGNAVWLALAAFLATGVGVAGVKAEESRNAEAEVRVAQTPVGQAPSDKPENNRPDVPITSARGGVLTPKGMLVIEPSVEYAHTSVDRFVFQGVEIVDTVLIGVIDASLADREVVTTALGFRYGVTDRFEIDIKFPWLFRNDKMLDVIPDPLGGASTEQERTTKSNGLGDVEMGLHYQINDGGPDQAFYVANLRIKSNTGEGPFEVPRDPVTGLETELAMGSGFWGIEPSLTVLLPSDPAIFFGNIGYLWNIQENIDKTIATVLVGEVDPGDSVRASFGMGYGINEKASFSIGYQHDFILATKTELNGVWTTADRLDIGALSFGANYQVSDTTSVNLSVLTGVTEDAPDVRIVLRIPIAMSLF